jgi:hypothetical protein
MAKSLIFPKIARTCPIDLMARLKSMGNRPLIWKNTVPLGVRVRAREGRQGDYRARAPLAHLDNPGSLPRPIPFAGAAPGLYRGRFTTLA